MRTVLFVFLFGIFFINVGRTQVVRIGAANLIIEGGRDLPGLLKKVDALAREARTKSVSHLLLPELITFDLLQPEPKKILPALQKIAGIGTAFEAGVSAIAKKHELTILGASTLIAGPKGLVNRSYVFGPDGNSRVQDKVHPTPWEQRHGIKGVPGVHLFQEEAFSFVILVCHDAEFPSISSQLSRLRPEVIFVPSQTDDLWGLERVRRTSAARAIEHMAYVVMTGASGKVDAKWHTYVGKNFLFTPKNRYFQDLEDQAGTTLTETELTVFEVDLGSLRKGRADEKQVYPAREEALAAKP